MTLQQRLARLEAIEDIRQLKARNFDDRDDMLAVFTDLACQPHIVEMHHGQNPRIEVQDADHATGNWGLYYYLIDTHRQIVTQLAGVYDDTYVRCDGRWQITRSHYDVTSTQIFDLSEGLARVIFAGTAAPVALDDPGKQAL
jgi:hypothetical protein